jgi:hypothetical protein
MSMLYGNGKVFESPAKIRVRAQAYERVGRQALFGKYHIVIASQACGDIKFLLGLGVQASRIIACDIDPIARHRASRYGIVVSPYPDIAKTVQWANDRHGSKNIASINVDLCHILKVGIPILDRCLDCKISPNCMIFFTFLRGRVDGMQKKEREELLETFYAIKQCLPYNSYTKDKRGANMCLAIL